MDDFDGRASMYVLRGLLHYHERMMSGVTGLRVRLVQPDGDESEPVALRDVFDLWSDGLREAIRCVEQVHGLTEEKAAENPAGPGSPVTW